MHSLMIRHPSPDWQDEEFSSLPVEYVLVDGVSENVKDRGSCELAQLNSVIDSFGAEGDVRIAVLVPDELVLSIRIAIPGRRASNIAKAIPFAVEPFLAGELSANHVAHGEIRRGIPTDCLVIEHATLQALIDGYTEAGLDIDIMTTRTAMMDVDESQVVVLCDESDCILKTSEDAIRVDRAQVADHLRELHLDIESETTDFVISASAEEDIEDLQTVLPTEHVTVVRWKDTFLTEFARRAHGVPVANLLQGEYEREKETDFEWRKLILPTSVAASWMAIAIAVLLGQGIWASLQHQGILDESELIYRSVFEEPSNSKEPAMRMAQRLPGSSSVAGLDFLTLWGDFLSSVEETDSGLQVVSTNYSDQPRELLVTCTSQTSFDVGQLQDSLLGKGVNMEIVSQRTDASGESSNLKLTPAR